MSNTEFFVIGSGIGGLCCAALLAHYGLEVIVCESHTIAGGAAHSFQRDGFIFDSGPSLYSGLSYNQNYGRADIFKLKIIIFFQFFN